MAPCFHRTCLSTSPSNGRLLPAPSNGRLLPARWARAGLLLLASLLLWSLAEHDAAGQSTESFAELDFTVQEKIDLKVVGNPTLSIGQLGEPVKTEEGAASYNLVNTGQRREITAALEDELPDGLTLEANVEAPELQGEGEGQEARSLGWTPLDTDESPVVKDVQKTDDEGGVPIQYRATVDVELPPGGYEATVMYTISEE